MEQTSECVFAEVRPGSRRLGLWWTFNGNLGKSRMCSADVSAVRIVKDGAVIGLVSSDFDDMLGTWLEKRSLRKLVIPG